jgi:hypothetical protein
MLANNIGNRKLTCPKSLIHRSHHKERGRGKKAVEESKKERGRKKLMYHTLPSMLAPKRKMGRKAINHKIPDITSFISSFLSIPKPSPGVETLHMEMPTLAR